MNSFGMCWRRRPPTVRSANAMTTMKTFFHKMVVQCPSESASPQFSCALRWISSTDGNMLGFRWVGAAHWAASVAHARARAVGRPGAHPPGGARARAVTRSAAKAMAWLWQLGQTMLGWAGGARARAVARPRPWLWQLSHTVLGWRRARAVAAKLMTLAAEPSPALT